MEAGNEERLKTIVELMMHQDTITWTAFEVSLSVQAAIGTLYSQFSVGRPIGTALVGALLAFAFGLLTFRSNQQMGFYAKKATERGLPEPVPLRLASTAGNYAKGRLFLWRAYSGTVVMAATHILLFGAWVLVASNVHFFSP